MIPPYILFGDNIYIRHRVGEIIFDIACKALNPNGLRVLQVASTFCRKGGDLN